MRRGPLLTMLVAFNALVALTVIIVLWRHPPGAVAAPPAGSKPLQTPHFTLQDCHGHTVTERTYRGKVLLVYFGYSFCPDVCPTELGYQARLLKALGADAAAVVPLFITIDPARDTPAHLASYVALFDPRVIGLTGSAAQIRQAATVFGAWYQRAGGDGRRMGPSATAAVTSTVSAAIPAAPTTSTDPGLYLMDHTSSTYLIDRSGHLQGTIDAQDRMEDALRAVRACL